MTNALIRHPLYGKKAIEEAAKQAVEERKRIELVGHLVRYIVDPSESRNCDLEAMKDAAFLCRCSRESEQEFRASLKILIEKHAMTLY